MPSSGKQPAQVDLDGVTEVERQRAERIAANRRKLEVGGGAHP